MKGGSIAKRYATALLRVAEESGQLDKIQTELNRMVSLVAENPGLKETLESPVVPPSQKEKIFLELEKKLGLGEAVKNLILILISRDRVAVLSMLGLIFRGMADEAMGQVRVQVKVAAPLGKQEETLKGILEKTLGRTVILETIVDPKLLGGLYVKVGDRVFDGSLKRELENIKKNILEKAVA